MKKSIIALLLAVAFVAGTDAFASRARLIVTGTGDGGQILDNVGGSLYADDAYNMFYNPSYVNDYKDWGILERHNGNGASTTAGASNAFGGFVTSMMNMNWGFFFNRTSGLAQDSLNTTAAGTGATVGSTMRPIELIVGGDHGIKWGAMLSYGRYKLSTATNSGTSQDLNLRLGAQFDGFDPFVSWRIAGSERGYDTTNGNAFTSQTHKDLMVGTRYHWGEWTPYAAWRWMKTGSITNKNAYGLGLGRNSKIAEGVKLHYGFGFWHNVKNAASNNTNVVPVDMAVEGDVTSWLTLRGGLNYRLWDQTGNGTNNDATSSALGASFKFSKLTMDWTVGTGTAAGAGGAAPTTNAQSFGFDGGFFTAASVQYNW